MAQNEADAAAHDRRRFLRAAAAAGGMAAAGGALAACGASVGAGAGARRTVAPAGTELGKAADVEIAGARIYAAAKVLVSRPAKADFRAFSAICTHQGCVLGEIRGDAAVCPCHHSQFSIEDGSVLRGPATEPLAAQPLTVKGADLVLG